MAYSPVKQSHADPSTASYRDLTSGTTPSPRLANLPFAPFNFSFEDLSRDTEEDGPNTRDQYADSKVSKFLSSLTSSSRQSYDLVEEDDYETFEQVTPTLENHPKVKMATTTELPLSRPPHEEKPMRTASISRQLPLNHPVPDLQSLQGAYVKNVVRLEESAEELSSKPSLEGELRRIKQEHWRRERAASGSSHANSIRSGPQRRVSTKSLANSITDVNITSRSGGYSPSAYVTSPVGSLNSRRNAPNSANKRLSKGSRLSQALPEPEFEGRPLDSDLTLPQAQESSNLDPRPVRSPSLSNASQVDRPTTSGSGDTYQQAKTLFTDFDGVHFAPDGAERGRRRISLSRPPRARDSRAFKEPQPGEEMIYYPAPVPVMLNLPVRLSRMNWADQEKKRLQALSDIPDDMRKSAAWLANEEGVPAPRPRHSKLPPQLRASAFFDHRGTTQEVQLKDGSAVATLDSILDAAAHAPVSAFTDHPIVGNLGSDFYASEQPSRKSAHIPNEKKAKRKSSLSNLLKPRRSSGNLSEAMTRESRLPSMLLSKRESHENDEDAIEDDAEHSILPDPDEIPDHESEHNEAESRSETDSDSHESQILPGFSAAPTTLLAELQMRKAQQRMRNRTAVDAFPNGMHSTLLELDTVTQLQLKARRQKHVKLAWEDKDLVDKENFDDDDIPLGVLFPEKEQQTNINTNRPLGLMEKKELEENEPLSHRRARLRGEPLQIPAPARSPAISQQEEEPAKPMLDLPDLGGGPDEDDNNEEETLAQRKQRMKNRKEHGASTEFARQVSTELGLKVEAAGSAPPASKTPEIEETLGQRRRRLQAEALQNGSRNVSEENQNGRPILRPRKSLADVLRANPIGYVDPNEKKTAVLAMQMQERAREREEKFFAAQAADKQQAMASRSRFGQGNESGLIQSPIYNQPSYQQPYTNTAGVSNAMTNANLYYGQHPHMNTSMGMAPVQPNYPYQYPPVQNFGYQSMMDMGPPLDQKQRARIEGWRQGVM